jgi:subtilisin-like proprotein convertase family protein
MASPTVSGSLILLQQLYQETYCNYIKAATLKGLTLHTAREAGSHPGPDYAFGWGLMNTAAAAETIVNNGLNALIKEISLNQGETYSFTVESNGIEPLMASICWTDPAGRVITGQPSDLLDNPTPALVNDLDIRIIQNGTTYFPWKLNPANPSAAAQKGDNLVDNFEKIQVDNPSGTYTVVVLHKGNLKYNKQDVSIIVTGLSHPFAINTTDGEKRAVCSSSTTSVTYNLRYTKTNNISGPTNFSINGLPGGANAIFTPTSMSDNGNFSLEITDLDNVAAGLYNLEMVGTNNGQQITKDLQLHVLKNNFDPQLLLAPADGSIDLKKPFNLEWASHPNAQNYELQVAVNADFSNIIIDETISRTSYLIKEHTYGITDGSTYYWRVKPANQCADGNFSAIRSFSTLQVQCNQEFNTTAVNIPTSGNTSPIISQINFGHNSIISNTKVYVDITHSQISDLEIKIVSPSNTEVILNQTNTCDGNYQNMQVVYDDNSENYLECYPTPPAIRDDIKPFESLSTFNGENAQGNWQLQITDPVNDNGGSLNMWALEICEELPAGFDNHNFELFKVWPNPTDNQINIQISPGKKIELILTDLAGRVIFKKVYNNTDIEFNKTIILGNFKKGTYLLQANSANKSGIKKIVIK